MTMQTTMVDHRQEIEQLLDDLSEDNLMEVLNFLQYLLFKKEKAEVSSYRVVDTFEGIWQDYPINEEDVAEARQEMWGGFAELKENYYASAN